MLPLGEELGSGCACVAVGDGSHEYGRCLVEGLAEFDSDGCSGFGECESSDLEDASGLCASDADVNGAGNAHVSVGVEVA